MTEARDLCVDETAIVQRNALLAAIVRSANDAIIAIDAGGTIISWNHGAQLHFGFSESEMIGLPVDRFVPADRMSEEQHALERIFAGEMVRSFHAVRTNKRGQAIPVSIAMSPITDSDGRIVAASSIIRPRPNRRATPKAGDQRELWSQFAPDCDVATHRNILVVEDETLMGLGLVAMLENAGFDVLGPTGDVDCAMAMLDSHECALAILDVNLRAGETSAPLAQRLKRDNIPFFVISGDVPVAPIAAFAEARSLAKPVGARKLVAIVHEMLD